MSIEEIIKRDPNIVKIIPAEEWDLPEIDYSRFERRETVEKEIKKLKGFLYGPYVLDGFQNQEERRRWRQQMQDKYGSEFESYYNRNCLRNNALNKVNSARMIIERFYSGKDKPELMELTGRIKQKPGIFRDYERKTNQEKLGYTIELKQNIYALLKFLAKGT